MPAIRTAKEIIYLEHMIPGVQMVKEKGSYWTNSENSGDLDVLIKDVFLLPFHTSIAVILITHFFISAFKTWQNLIIARSILLKAFGVHFCFPS